MRKQLSAIVWMLAIVSSIQAQIILERSVIAASGFDSPTLSWTMGEIITTTAATSSIVLTQGFHQPDTTITIGVNESSAPSVAVTLYPNPTNGKLNLRFSEAAMDKYQVSVYDFLGQQCLSTYHFNAEKTLSLNVGTLSAGLYIVRIDDGIRAIHIRFQKID